jgi:lipopolysaccharide biosynthesis protein
LNRADGDHHGEIFHDYWANVFYNNYKESLT